MRSLIEIVWQGEKVACSPGINACWFTVVGACTFETKARVDTLRAMGGFDAERRCGVRSDLGSFCNRGNKIPVAPFFSIQFSNNSGRQTPTRIADGHADSHDEYGMSPCRYLRKLLKRHGEIVITHFWGGKKA
jgi:hypothetical protein